MITRNFRDAKIGVPFFEVGDNKVESKNPLAGEANASIDQPKLLIYFGKSARR